MDLDRAYTDVSTLKAWNSDTDAIHDNDRYEFVIEAASRWIDTYCERHFYQVTETRTVRSTERGALLSLGPYNDLVEVTAVTSADEPWLPATYKLRRFSGGETYPYGLLSVVDLDQHRFAETVEIEGTWGWPAVPTMVRQGCLIQAARLFKRSMSPEGVAGFGEYGAIRVGRDLDPDVRYMLDPYRHPESALVA